MARLSRDDSSWRAHGLKKRYAEFDPDKTPKKKNKKDTKKWCRGVEGHPHDIRQVVIGVNPNCWECRRKDDDKPCNHLRTVTKCVNCNATVTGWGWRAKKTPTKTNKRPQGVITQQEILAEKWCDEGHLWDWTEWEPKKSHPWRFDHFSSFGKKSIRFDSDGNMWRKEWKWIKEYRTPRVWKHCVMCGLERRSQSRQITADDVPKEYLE